MARIRWPLQGDQNFLKGISKSVLKFEKLGVGHSCIFFVFFVTELIQLDRRGGVFGARNNAEYVYSRIPALYKAITALLLHCFHTFRWARKKMFEMVLDSQ